MSRANRGQIRIIEAFLAIFIVFSSFAISIALTGGQKNTDVVGLADVGFQVLLKLDSSESLSKFILEEDWVSLREALSLALPAGMVFNLTVYDAQMRQVNLEVVSNGNFGSQNIAFTEYICAGQEPAFQCYIIHLYLARAT